MRETPPSAHADSVDLLRQRIETDLRLAMKTRQALSVKTLRSLLGTLDNASAVEQTSEHVPVYGRSGDVPRKMLSLQEGRSLLRSEVRERLAAAGEYERLGQAEEASRLRAEAAVIERYLA